MTPKSSTLLAGAASLLLAACASDGVLPTDPSGAARPSALPLGDVQTAAAGPGLMVSGLAANLCADVWTASTAPGASVAVYPCHGEANQQFALQPTGEITAYNGALCLDVWQAKANDGDRVVVWTCNGGPNQKWTRTAAGEIQTAVNGKCLDVWGGKAVSGARLAVYQCHGGANQKWTVNDGGAGAPAPSPPPASAPPPINPIVADTASVGGSAQLPQAYLSTAMPVRTGKTINVAAGGDLQAAIDAAGPGDEVVLPAGATFVGNFLLRAKPNMAGQWITVRSGGQLPAEGTRATPADAGQMPKLLTPNSWGAAIATDPGAQGWRLTGLEVGTTSDVAWTYSLVNFGTIGSEQTTLAQVPSRLVLDRSYVHGSATLDVRRCVALNSASTAIVDSYLADCHSHMNESQAILGWNGPGPFKIANNHIEGGSQCIMFGGSDPSVPNLIPSDIEVRRNHVTRPMSWRGVWSVKNLVELKAGQRVLFEGNVFENNWPDAQSGFAFVWWSANADGGALWSVTQDITFRYNRVRNVHHGFNLADRYNGSLPRMSRVTIAHNLMTGPDTTGGRLIMVTGTITGVTIAQNTGFGGSHNLLFATPDQPLPSLVYRNNVAGADYTFFATGVALGAAVVPAMGLSAANVAGNVLVNGNGLMVPPGNAQAATRAAIGFVDAAGGNFQLAPTSPYRTSGVGGTLPGADITTLSQAVQGVAP